MTEHTSTATAPAVTTQPVRRDRTRAVAYVAAGVAVVATLVATARGPGMGPDSANYVSAGLNLAAGEGLRTFNGSLLTMFAPGLPALVALGERIGVADGTWLRVLNGLCFGVTVLLAHVLVRRHVRSDALVVGATVFVALSVTLLADASMALSEAVFVPVCLGFVVVLERLGPAERPARRVLAAAALVAAVFALRYTGLALVAIGGLSILWMRWTRDRWVALAWACLFGALSLVVPVMWALRNRGVDGTLLGPRSPSPDGPLVTVQRYVTTLGKWLLPAPTPLVLQAAAGVAVVLAAAVGVVWLWRSDQGDSDDHGDAAGSTLVPLVVFTAGYSAYLLAAQLVAAFDPIGPRLMAPVYVPLVVLGAWLLDRLVRPAGRVLAPWALRALGVGLVALVAFQGCIYLYDALRDARDGIEYSAPSWTDGDVVALAADVPDGDAFYSNVPAGIWSAVRREPIVRSPERRARRADVAVPMSTEFLETVACEPAWLLWYDEAEGDYLFTPEELADHVEIEAVREVPDGTLYRLGPLDPGPQGPDDVDC